MRGGSAGVEVKEGAGKGDSAQGEGERDARGESSRRGHSRSAVCRRGCHVHLRPLLEETWPGRELMQMPQTRSTSQHSGQRRLTRHGRGMCFA